MNGKKHGHGIQYFSDGSQYEGNFINGTYNGNGTYYWADGQVYTGQYQNDTRNGSFFTKLS